MHLQDMRNIISFQKKTKLGTNKNESFIEFQKDINLKLIHITRIPSYNGITPCTQQCVGSITMYSINYASPIMFKCMSESHFKLKTMKIQLSDNPLQYECWHLKSY